MAHITGGGLIDNIPRVLPEGLDAEIKLGSWTVPPLFRLLADAARIGPEELHQVFNMGIGMVLIVAAKDAAKALKLGGGKIIGRIVKGTRCVKTHRRQAEEKILNPMPKRALLSVSDKTGLVDFAQALVEAGYDLISTGGTATALRTAGLTVSDISDITGFPEMMDGRVKTLHPKVHGGLLFLRDNPEHQAQAQAHDIAPIDLVVVNLYPFEQTIAKPGVTLEHAIENIDIGGPSMLRSAAKNYRSVTVITDPADYAIVAGEIGAQGDTTLDTRERLAAKVFRTTGYYDALIANYLAQRVPERGAVPRDLRAAACAARRRCVTARIRTRTPRFTAPSRSTSSSSTARNFPTTTSSTSRGAVRLIREFHRGEPTVAILKHTNPCGVGSGATLAEAWDKAYATDRQAPFGGIIVVNRPLDLATAQLISEIFSEVIIAPAFNDDALALLIEEEEPAPDGQWRDAPRPPRALEIRSAVGDSFLLQGGDADIGFRRRLESRHQAAADRRGARRAALRLARGQAREVQRHRLRRARPHAGRRRGPDVARRFLAHRDLEGRRGQALPRGQHRRLGRFLPLPRRPDRRRRGGRDRRHPARRQRERCRRSSPPPTSAASP